MNGENGKKWGKNSDCSLIRLFYGKALLNYLTVSHIPNQYKALSEDSSLRKVFSGAIGSRVVNQSTDHRAGLNHQFLLCPSSHTCASRNTHTDTNMLAQSQAHRHTLKHRYPTITTKAIIKHFYIYLSWQKWRWQQTTVESMVFVKHSETQSKGVAVSLQGLVLAKRVNICKSLTTVS